MTAVTAEQGLEIPRECPFGNPESALRVFALLMPCLLASFLVDASRAGSVAVLCFLLPLAFVARDLWHRRREARVQFQAVMALGAMFGVALEPGWLNVTMSWLLLLALAIEARSEGTHVALSALRAVAWAIAASPFGMVMASGAAALRLPLKPKHIARVPFTSLILPVLAVAVFAPLLAAANPRFEEILLSLDLGNPIVWIDRLVAQIFTVQTFIFLLAFAMLWPVLRGKNAARDAAIDAGKPAPLWHATFFKPLAVAMTLVLLNLLFAVENSLDMQHLWLNPATPGSYSHADYVHRGAYTLIFTAALAGVLMLTALRKGTVTESASHVRLLVYVFAAQNLLLVASSVQRTLLYIDAYGWTEWRVSGLAWMALVFFGLLTIFWRVAHNRDSRWLINANIVAATVLLVGFSVWNMQGFIAWKNVERATLTPVPSLDTQYMAELSVNALPALKHYESTLSSRQRLHTHDLVTLNLNVEKARIKSVGSVLSGHLLKSQRNWRSWTWRHAV